MKEFIPRFGLYRRAKVIEVIGNPSLENRTGQAKEGFVTRSVPYLEAIRSLTHCCKQSDAERLFASFLDDHPDLQATLWGSWTPGEDWKPGEPLPEHWVEVMARLRYQSWNAERRREYKKKHREKKLKEIG